MQLRESWKLFASDLIPGSVARQKTGDFHFRGSPESVRPRIGLFGFVPAVPFALFPTEAVKSLHHEGKKAHRGKYRKYPILLGQMWDHELIRTNNLPL